MSKSFSVSGNLSAVGDATPYDIGQTADGVATVHIRPLPNSAVGGGTYELHLEVNPSTDPDLWQTSDVLTHNDDRVQAVHISKGFYYRLRLAAIENGPGPDLTGLQVTLG